MTYSIERELTPDITLIIPLNDQNLNNITDNDDSITTDHVQFRTKIKNFEISTINKARYETQANTAINALITTITNLMSPFDASAQYWFKQDVDEPLYNLHKQIFKNATDLCKAETKWQSEALSTIKYYLAVHAYCELVTMSSANTQLYNTILALTDQDKASYNYNYALSKCSYNDMISLWLDQLNKQNTKALRDFLNL